MAAESASLFSLAQFLGMKVETTGVALAGKTIAVWGLTFKANTDDLIVETQVVKPGRRIVHLESRATDAAGRLVATATGSYAVLPIPSP